MNNPHAPAGSPLTCPKCQSFGVREVSVHGYDLHGFSCHDCRHVFYLRAAGLQRERDKMGETVRPRQPKTPKNDAPSAQQGQADQEAGKVARLPSRRKQGGP